MQRSPSPSPAAFDRTGGAVIIVVLALLSLMLFLGIFFFEFAQEEQQSSENFAGANLQEVVDPEAIFSEALEQLIVGPRAERTLSTLWNGDFASGNNYGNVHSMLAHVIGPIESGSGGVETKHGKPRDVIPHNGAGIRPIFVDVDGDGDLDVRFDHDGDGDPDSTLDPSIDSTFINPNTGFLLPGFAINFSQRAQVNKLYDAFNQDVPATGGDPDYRTAPFIPDTDYTTADFNHLYLAHDEMIGDHRVLVPSFCRPVLFPSRRDSDGNGPNSGGGAAGFSGLYTAAGTSGLVLRPHTSHTYPGGTPRYLVAGTTAAQSGDTTRIIGPFPFTNDQDGDGNANELGIYSTTDLAPNGLLSIPACNNYELDVDTDGDGFADAIWIDIGLDMVDLPDGRQYVPLVAFKVLDADSLGNINVHGNLQGMFTAGSTFDSGNSLSVSNQGLSPSEVNLVRLLNGDPSQFGSSTRDLYRAQADYAKQFNFMNNVALSPLEMGNMDIIGLLSGRRVNGTGSPLPGRNGEEYLLTFGAFPNTASQHPRAGVWGVDDDQDSNNADARFDGGRSRNELLYDSTGGGSATVTIPPFVHPIALSGVGSDVVTNAGIEQRPLVQPIAGNPSVWPGYTANYDDPSNIVSGSPPYDQAGVTPYSHTGYTGLMPSTNLTQGVIDEENEVIASHSQRDRVNDNLFSPSESIFLHVSNTDYQRANGRSRLDQLLPFNFRSARTASDIRKRFTPDSWDFTEMSYVNYRAGEYSQWDPSNVYPTDIYDQGDYYFPPLFGGLTLYNPPNSGFSNPLDPIRPEVRRLLASEVSTNTDNIGENRPSHRQRLNLNRLLAGFDNAGNPIYRNLMPHPDFVTLENEDTSVNMAAFTIPDMIHAHNVGVALPLSDIQPPASEPARVTTARAQEWWARYDRQRLARDIYTLLYLTGAKFSDSPASAAYAIPAYPDRTTNGIPDNVEEMAQFAVNYVDALDRDDVITTFEYDENLSDGWSAAPTNKVYGIERQLLTFSEVMFLQLKQNSTELTQTLHKEENATTHQILHIELRNALPFPVNLDEGWRLVRVPTSTGQVDISCTFKSKGYHVNGTTPRPSVIGAGENFLIACHDGTLKTGSGVNATSDLFANIDADPDLESILPNSNDIATSNMDTPNPQTNLDLSATGFAAPNYDHENYHYGFVPGTTGYLGTTFVNVDPLPTMPMPAPMYNDFDLVLQRRQNLRGIASGGSVAGLATDVPNESTGRWIEVDRFSVKANNMGGTNAEFAPAGNTSAAMLTALQTLHSIARPQPFVPKQQAFNNGAPAGARNHSMSIVSATDKAAANPVNGGPGSPFSIWQPHFDRDFTSAYDLLSIPIYGSHPTGDINLNYANTYYPEIHGGTVVNLARGDVGMGGTGVALAGDFTAGVRFLFPTGKPALPYYGWNPVAYANDWHRLFEFVQVPRRTEQSILSQYPNTFAGAIKPLTRTPGLINLNTIRDETILAALLDDNLHFPATPIVSGFGFYSTHDRITPTRNWYTDLRRGRDGVDEFMENSGLDVTIPGTLSPYAPGSPTLPYVPRPFRSSSHVDLEATATVDNAIESTLLRSRPLNPRPTGAPGTPSGALTNSTIAAGQSPWDSTTLTTPTNPTTGTAFQTLLEAKDFGNHDMDYSTRNRLLAKVANNTTTKSHVFLVWTAVGYFEAHRETTNNYVQIGARITDIPIHRSFGVVDMTRLEDAYDAYSQTFDYSKFVIARKRLR